MPGKGYTVLHWRILKSLICLVGQALIGSVIVEPFIELGSPDRTHLLMLVWESL